MSNWELLCDWIATVAVASFAWISSLVAPHVSMDAPAGPSVSAAVDSRLNSVMRWAQPEEVPPIEQVGEETDEDVEMLDEAAPLATEVDTDEDVELLDQGSPAAVRDDIELLDQGPPSATVSAVPTQSFDTTAAVTMSVAPAASTGPVLPRGFGTGDVHVATGSGGFPVGLENCHVGAVTGRAYVGVDCGDGGGNLFVGHVPSFEEFPFVLTDNFPFDRESVVGDRGRALSEDNVDILVSAARGATGKDNSAKAEIRTSGRSSVAFEQRARDGEPRAETKSGRSTRGKGKHQSGNADASASESQDATNGTSAESVHQKKGKDRIRSNLQADGQKKSKNSHDSKKHGGKKGKKSRPPK